MFTKTLLLLEIAALIKELFPYLSSWRRKPKNLEQKILFYHKLVGLPSFARDFYYQLCLYVSLLLCLYVSLSLLSISPKPNLTWNMPADWPARPPPSFSLSPPPSLFPDKKFPVEAHFWLDKLFYYIDIG